MSEVIKTRPFDIVDIKNHIPTLIVELPYATVENFCGAIVPGYNQNIAYLQVAAINSLKTVNSVLERQGFCLYIFDAYRPVSAVKYFYETWRVGPVNATLQTKYYPGYTKNELFEEGLLATQSSHSRGSTLDLSLFNIQKNSLVDMGTCFDYFHKASHTSSNIIKPHQSANRMILKNIMEENGFINYSKEWWHFRFKNEKYSRTYFDFEIN